MKAASPRQIAGMSHDRRVVLLREYYNGPRIPANTLPQWRDKAASANRPPDPGTPFIAQQTAYFEAMAETARLATGVPALIDEIEILKSELFTLGQVAHELIVAASEPEDGHVKIPADVWGRMNAILGALHGG